MWCSPLRFCYNSLWATTIEQCSILTRDLRHTASFRELLHPLDDDIARKVARCQQQPPLGMPVKCPVNGQPESVVRFDKGGARATGPHSGPFKWLECIKQTTMQELTSSPNLNTNRHSLMALYGCACACGRLAGNEGPWLGFVLDRS